MSSCYFSSFGFVKLPSLENILVEDNVINELMKKYIGTKNDVPPAKVGFGRFLFNVFLVESS